MMVEVGVHEAKTQLSKLLARVESGEEIAITNRGRVVARLVPPVQPRPGMVLGTGVGDGSWIADDFDAPLDDELLDLFEGR